jgi:hypothetical protein
MTPTILEFWKVGSQYSELPRRRQLHFESQDNLQNVRLFLCSPSDIYKRVGHPAPDHAPWVVIGCDRSRSGSLLAVVLGLGLARSGFCLRRIRPYSALGFKLKLTPRYPWLCVSPRCGPCNTLAYPASSSYSLRTLVELSSPHG